MIGSISTGRVIAGSLLALLALSAAAAAVFADDLARFLIAPRSPYQVYAPPPSPDYDLASSWHFRSPAQDAGVDIFYLHSTTFYASSDWNAPIGDEDASNVFRRTAAPNEIGPFAPIGRVVAPKYRQATLFAEFTHKTDGREARRTAYADVANAFAAYLDKTEGDDRPLFLVGYGQGGLHALRLLEEYFPPGSPALSRLVAAYVVDQPTPTDLFAERLSHAPLCAFPDDVRCVISYVSRPEDMEAEIRRMRRRGMSWTEDGDLRPIAKRALACVNPLVWSADASAPPDRHIGAASATGLSVTDDAIPIPGAVGARCVDGVLVTDEPKQRYLQRRRGFGREWRAQNYNLFYYDLRENALERLAAWRDLREEERRTPPPIGEAEEISGVTTNRIDPPAD